MFALVEKDHGEADYARGREGKLRTFLRYKDQVKALLDKGYTVMQVWSSFRKGGVMDVSYSSFSTYVKNELGRIVLPPVYKSEQAEKKEESEGVESPEREALSERDRRLIYGEGSSSDAEAKLSVVPDGSAGKSKPKVDHTKIKFGLPRNRNVKVPEST